MSLSSPSIEGTELVLNVTLDDKFCDGSSWGDKLVSLLTLRPVIINYFLQREGAEGLEQVSQDLAKSAGNQLGIFNHSTTLLAL